MKVRESCYHNNQTFFLSICDLREHIFVGTTDLWFFRQIVLLLVSMSLPGGSDVTLKVHLSVAFPSVVN